MVQLFYYENRGRCARRILRHDSTTGGGWRWAPGGRSSDGCRVLLYPDEGWARPAGLSSWQLQPVWWSRSRCRVVEMCGTHRSTAVGRMTTTGNGSHVTVVGKFKEPTLSTGDASSSSSSSSSSPTPSCSSSSSSSSASPVSAGPAASTSGRDFKLSLSTDVTNADFQLGYCMTGTLERGDRKAGNMEMTHYAMVKRKGY